MLCPPFGLIRYFCTKQVIMLRGAYSHLNHFSKLILLLTITFSFLLFSTLFGILMLVPFYGAEVLSLLSAPNFTDPSVITAMKAVQIINMAGGLLLPAILYLWLCTPAENKFDGFRKPNSLLPILLSVVLIILAQPLIGLASELNSKLVLPEWLSFIETRMRNAEHQGELVTEAFLSTTSTTGLLVNIFMITILPSFAEEILFRGALAGLLRHWTRNIHLAVFISSFIFAFIHFQFYGFLPRFLLGIALGYLFFWSGSLWLPIAAHFANNFLTVIIEFLYRKGIILNNAENFGTNNAPLLLVISIASVTGIFYYIYKTSAAKEIPVNELTARE
jgi:membrane protease YdiL (CAAX protease family)